MSYYNDAQWNAPGQNNWEHQGATTPVRASSSHQTAPTRTLPLTHLDSTGASAPQPQDDYAFSYQFDGMYFAPGFSCAVQKAQR